MKRMNLPKYGARILKLSGLLLAAAISVAAQTEQQSGAAKPDGRKTIKRPVKKTSPLKSGGKTEIENDNGTIGNDDQTIENQVPRIEDENHAVENENQMFKNENPAAENEPDAPTQEPARRRIVDRDAMKKRRASFGNFLLAPFRRAAPFVNLNVTKFENNQRLNRFGIILDNPYIQPLVGGLGESSGFGAGVRVSTADKLSPAYKLFASGHATFNGYTELLAGVEAAPKNWANGKVKFNLKGRYLLRPEEDFFGTGANSFRSHRTSYFRREHAAKFDVGWQIVKRLKIGAFTDFSLNSITDGRDKTIARITERFNEFDTPGSARNIRLLDTGFFAEYEGRDAPENPRAGTYFYAAASTVDGLGKNSDYGWLNYDFDARGYVPLGSKRRVLALRLLGNFKDTKGDSSVPLHRLARLGDGETLRGYESYRYQGLNALHLNVEYRFALMQNIKSEGFNRVEAIVFSDLGQVFNRREELTLANIQSTYGGGLQFASSRNVIFRVLYAVSPEKSRLILRFGKSF